MGNYCVYFYSYSRKHLDSSIFFFYNFFNYYFFGWHLDGLILSKSHRMPTRRKVFALLRSPHVNKKSQEHLGIYQFCSFLYIPLIKGKLNRLCLKFFSYFLYFFSFRVVITHNYNWFFYLNNELH